ncbi:MAG: amidohydrolase family protein [Planctomycetota bacterium]
MAHAPLTLDLHTHIMPRDLPDLCAKYGYDGFIRLDHHRPCGANMFIGDRFFREVEHNCWDPAVRLEECERDGVHVQALSTVPVLFSYWAQPRDTLDLSRFLNDHIADVVSRYPTRFIGLGTIPMQDAELAIVELERCVRDLGFPGVQIGTNVNGLNLDAPELFAIFEKAAELGASVFVHPWDMLGKERMPSYFLPWLVGMPAETSLAICSLLFGGVLERLPQLKICFAHGGGGFPGTIARIEKGFHARPDLTQVQTQRSPRSFLGEFYVDSLVHDPEVLRSLISLVGSDRVALGSDYPFPLGETEPGSLIRSMTDLDADVRARLLSGTACEFLGVSDTLFRSA